MATENILLLVLYSGLVCASASVFLRYKSANPVFWFLILQWVIASGTIAIADLSLSADLVYVALFFLSLLAFSLGALGASLSLDVPRAHQYFIAQKIQGDSQLAQTAIVVIFLVSVLVTVLYFRAVGYNLFIDLALGRSIEDFTSARLAAYSGEEYFAPGYANQFKNVLLPLTLSAMAVWALYSRRRVTFWVLLVIGIPIVLYALLGTGQRGFLVYAFAALLFGLSTFVNLRIGRMLGAVVLVVVLFGIFSFYLGRIDDLSIGSVLLQILTRMFVDEQQGSLVGFRYVHSVEVAWFSEWARGLMGVLPGHRGSDLDHHIFSLIHGTSRGTATLSTVGSVFHNAGVVGVLGVYLLLGWAYMMLYWRFLKGRRTVLRCLTYGALFFYLAFFVAGAPVGLINKGVVALAIVLLIRKFRILGSPSSNKWHLGNSRPRGLAVG